MLNLSGPFRQALEQLGELFTDLVLVDQDCFKEEEKWRDLLQLIPDAKIVKSLEKKWAHSEDRPSEDKWADFKAEVRASYSKEERVSPRDFFFFFLVRPNSLMTDVEWASLKAPMSHAMEDIVLQYTYPRIDAEVSKHRNHLLKAPFCVHPKTGRICVPVDPARIDQFDPELVPTVGQLLRELDATTTTESLAGTGEEQHSSGPSFTHSRHLQGSSRVDGSSPPPFFFFFMSQIGKRRR
jgi:DNA primase small subunit